MIHIPAFIPMMKMKRITALVLTVLLLLPSASAQTWDCVCGRIGNKGNYCGKCGRSREEALQAQTQADGQDAAEELRSIRSAGIGDTVTYGRYPQTAEGDDKTPIEWLVLDVQGDRALLLSRYGLDTMPYNTEYEDATWEACTLREWLNGEFLNRAFSSEEQKAIRTTAVDNGKSQEYSGWSATGGNDTQDKVFLLSYAEANRYLGVTREAGYNMRSRVSPTAYANKNSTWTNDRPKTADGEAAWWWWLRSPGMNRIDAASVDIDGSLNNYNVYYGKGLVRPVFWVDLNLRCSDL